MIVPVLKIAGEDRAHTLEIESRLSMALKRIELLDEAVFLVNGERGRSLFDDFGD
jgi:hypothetical protein